MSSHFWRKLKTIISKFSGQYYTPFYWNVKKKIQKKNKKESRDISPGIPN